jgi:hypothetical protein
LPEDCEDIEPVIRLAVCHVKNGHQGWTNPAMTKIGFLFGCIVRSWPDLREELHGCQPKVAVASLSAHDVGIGAHKWAPSAPLQIAKGKTPEELGWKSEEAMHDLVAKLGEGKK